MLEKIKKTLAGILPQSVKNEVKYIRNTRAKDEVLKEWENAGKPLPVPHHVKQQAIQQYQEKSKYEILVETGTYLGDMVNAQRKLFKKIYSIELGEQLYEDAVKRFASYSHIKLLQGDSGKVLGQVMAELDKPAIFWLDGHYSAGVTAKGDKDCPIYEEIDSIFNGKKMNHILLVDDARCFVGEGDYPTIENLARYVQSKDPRYKLSVQDDIIRFEIV